MTSASIRSDLLSAQVDTRGSELTSLRDARGRELLWDAGPAWPWHAPLLFPIIGRVPDDRIVHRGQERPLPMHGFARDHGFRIAEQTDAGVRLALASGPATLAAFPFDFELESLWSIEGRTLTLALTVANTDAEPLPFAVGWHPAFAWDGRPGWRVQFDEDEPAPVRRVREVLLTPERHPTPVSARALPISETVFAEGAVILDDLRSRRIHYCSPERRVLTLELTGIADFAIWKQPDAGFVCLEPWAGLPAPEWYRGEHANRPGLQTLAPGATATFACAITVH